MSKAKDPAVLWYYRDYLSGTEEMSWAEQGAYARLLNKQADKGHLSLDGIKKILKKDFSNLWPGISAKFLIDPDGNYYNERMDIEVAKRSKNSQTQRERIQKYWDEQRNKPGSTAEHSTVDTTVIPIANANAKGDFKKNDDTETQPIGIDRVAEVAGEVWANQRWVENTCMGQQVKPDDLQKWMAQFNASICNDKIADFGVSTYQKIFGGWLNRQKSKGYSLQAPRTETSNAPQLKKIAP